VRPYLIKTVKVDGENQPLQDLEAKANGVFFIGDLPTGKYTVVQTALPGGAAATPKRYFALEVKDDGTIEVGTMKTAQA
jgi:hypothetical protein